MTYSTYVVFAMQAPRVDLCVAAPRAHKHEVSPARVGGVYPNAVFYKPSGYVGRRFTHEPAPSRKGLLRVCLKNASNCRKIALPFQVTKPHCRSSLAFHKCESVGRIGKWLK